MNPDLDPRHPRKVSVKRRAADPGTVTSTAAQAAILQAVERRDRKRRAFQPACGAGVAHHARVAPSGTPTALNVVRVLVLAAVVALLWHAVTRRASPHHATGDASTCAVTGTVTWNGRPLSQAVIELHALEGGPDGTPVTVEADDAGAFARPASAGVAPGRYAVVVRSGCILRRPGADVGTPVAIPTRYTRPASSPLQVVVSGSARLDVALAP